MLYDRAMLAFPRRHNVESGEEIGMTLYNMV